jgi:hypothetical protein
MDKEHNEIGKDVVREEQNDKSKPKVLAKINNVV